MPSLSRNNAAMRLPNIMDGLSVYRRGLNKDCKLGVLFGDSSGNGRLMLLNLFLNLSITFKMKDTG